MLSKRLQLALPLLLLLLASCIGDGLPPSVWPPPNFRLVVEELKREGRSVHTVRRFQVDAGGIAVYGTSTQPLVDEKSGASWPVFDRLAVYRLEPKCVRALARRLDRIGIGELVVPASGIDSDQDTGLVVRWRAFQQQRDLPTAGRLRGQMAEIMAIIAAHLPDGEQFTAKMNRPVVTVLRGVPRPAAGVEGALRAYQLRLEDHPEDEDLLLAAYGLACRAGERETAQELLRQWQEVKQGQRTSGFSDNPETPAQRAKTLAQFLPQKAEQ